MAKFRDPKVSVSKAYAQTKRVMRTPQNPFLVQNRPFQIVPIMCHPVLPGETLKSLLCQSRTVSDPIKHPLIGWWKETFFFYVKHRDIQFHLDPTGVNRPFEDMMINPMFQPESNHTPESVQHNHLRGVNWLQPAIETITEYFFRDQGEDWNIATLGGYPLAQLNAKDVYQSLTPTADRRTDNDVDLDLDGDGNITVQEAEAAKRHWEALRSAGLEDMDYEDYLRTYGVKVPEVENSFNLHRPELIRHFKEWTYPTNTVDPTTGTPSSAVTWSTGLRADKDRFFKEPGFIVGLQVIRPKVYRREQFSAIGSLDNMEAWLPAIAHADYERSIMDFDVDEGPLRTLGTTEDPIPYSLDMRDLFIYGEQFNNYYLTDGDNAFWSVLANGNNAYPAAGQINALFRDAAKSVIKTDGLVSLNIAGRQRDMTPHKL